MKTFVAVKRYKKLEPFILSFLPHNNNISYARVSVQQTGFPRNRGQSFNTNKDMVPQRVLGKKNMRNKGF